MVMLTLYVCSFGRVHGLNFNIEPNLFKKGTHTKQRQAEKMWNKIDEKGFTIVEIQRIKELVFRES